MLYVHHLHTISHHINHIKPLCDILLDMKRRQINTSIEQGIEISIELGIWLYVGLIKHYHCVHIKFPQDQKVLPFE